MNDPLYERDERAWVAHLAEGNRTQARKRVGADVILRDEHERILLVDPTYKPDWDLPGGMAEANEPPDVAAQRELREELGLDVEVSRLLCVDWVSPHGPWDDSLMFVFDAGIVSDDTAATLQPVDSELAEVRFCRLQEVQQLLRPYVWRRVRSALGALRTGSAAYLRDGRTVSEG